MRVRTTVLTAVVASLALAASANAASSDNHWSGNFDNNNYKHNGKGNFKNSDSNYDNDTKELRWKVRLDDLCKDDKPAFNVVFKHTGKDGYRTEKCRIDRDDNGMWKVSFDKDKHGTNGFIKDLRCDDGWLKMICRKEDKKDGRFGAWTSKCRPTKRHHGDKDGKDCDGKVVPTPAAAGAGLALLGLMGLRRRR